MLVSIFRPLWSEKMLDVISIVLKLSRLVLCRLMWSIFEKVPCALEKKKIWYASRICVSSLRRGHANLVCIIPILVYVLPKQAQLLFFFFLRFYLSLEREGREKERERNINVWLPLVCQPPPPPPTQDLARNPGMCPEKESNW